MAISVTLMVLPDSHEEALKAAEVLSRAAAGLALDGLSVNLTMGTYESEDD